MHFSLPFLSLPAQHNFLLYSPVRTLYLIGVYQQPHIPQLTVNTDWGTDCFYTTVSLLTQMQYTSAGPEGNSANYAKYTGFILPECYIGATYHRGGFLGCHR